MAYRDYILCKTCGCKIVYDGDDNGRNRLETYWGKPDAPDWTVGLVCPDCIAQMEAERDALRADAERLAWLDEFALSVDMVADPDNRVQVWHSTTRPPYSTIGSTLREAIDAALKEAK